MFGVEGEFDDAQKKLRKAAYLTSPRFNDADLTEYRLGLTPEQAATLEAVIGPLSKPAPNDVTGERDLRPAEQRRAEALAAVCGQVAGQDADKTTPGGAGTTLHVGINVDDLLDHFPEPTPTPTPTRTPTPTDTNTDAGPDAGSGVGGGCGNQVGEGVAGDGVAGAGHDARAGDRASARV